MKLGTVLIATERNRQILKEKWTSEHDDTEHDRGELAEAAVCYAMGQDQRDQRVFNKSVLELFWPWEFYEWKPCKGRKGRIKELVKAGALIAAEIDRLQRTKTHE